MTFKALVPGPPQLGAMTARPYRVPLASDASPAAVVAQLREEDHPGALWGDWFDGGLLIFRRPLRVAEPLNAADGFECLDDQPLVTSDQRIAQKHESEGNRAAEREPAYGGPEVAAQSRARGDRHGFGDGWRPQPRRRGRRGRGIDCGVQQSAARHLVGAVCPAGEVEIVRNHQEAKTLLAP